MTADTLAPDDLVAQAIAELREVVQCRCLDAYKDRGLHDPECQCDSKEAVNTLVARIEALTAAERNRRVTLDAIDAAARKGRPPMKPDEAFRKHNQDAYQVTADELRQFVERAEQLESEKKDIADQQKENMAEAKARGYDTKILKKIMALRRRKPDEIAEEEAVLEMYRQALGMN